MNPYTPEKIKQLAAEGFFEYDASAACTAILPFVKPEHTGIELGVFRGDSSVLFMEYCTSMHFIDPCVEYPENPDKGWYASAVEFHTRLNAYAGRYKFYKDFAANVAHQIPEVDFAFIDGNHEYPFVKQDIELYWPKIRSGGFLSGHDYSAGHPGVTRAVDEFFQNLNLPVETHQYCWLVRKP